jgi:biotin carboxyl carrier protein
LNAQTPQPATRDLPEISFTDAKRFMEEMARLFDAAAAPEQFHRTFLQGVLQLTRAAGGALWGRAPHDEWQLQCEINFVDLGLHESPRALSLHSLLVRQAGQRDKASWVPPRSSSADSPGALAEGNPTRRALLFAPIVMDQMVVGVVEVWLTLSPDPTQRRQLARLLTEMAALEAAYLHKGQWQRLRQHQQLVSQTEEFSRQIHSTLDVREISYLIANEGRRLLGCDQFSVAMRVGRASKLQAVSGSPGFDKQSQLVRAMQELAGAVLAWGQRLDYQGAHSDDWPPEVQAALDRYLKESNSRSLLVLPLEEPREKKSGRPCSWALLAESFGPAAVTEQRDRALELLLPHAAAALYNAGQLQRLPLGSLAMALARLRDDLRGRRLVRAALFFGMATLVVGALTFLPVPCRYEAKGQLVPQQRQFVFAPLAGKVVEVKVGPGDAVEKGQELLFIEDLETQLQIDQLNAKITSIEQKLMFLSEQIGKSNSQEERVALTKERLSQDYELHRTMAEREILLLVTRSPRKAPVSSPLAGKVVTFDTQDQLLGKTVKPGDPLLRIAAIRGPWEIELNLTEAHVGAIRESLDRAPGGELNVDLLLASQPQRTFKARLGRDGLGGETIVKDNKVVLPVRARINDAELVSQLEKLPVGVEIKAKVNCGRRALSYVWFAELWDFLYENLIF